MIKIVDTILLLKGQLQIILIVNMGRYRDPVARNDIFGKLDSVKSLYSENIISQSPKKDM